MPAFHSVISALVSQVRGRDSANVLPSDLHRAVRPGSPCTADPSGPLLIRANATPANDAGQTRMRRTRLNRKVGGSIPSLPTRST